MQDKLLWRPWLGRSDMVVGTSGTVETEPDHMWWVVWGEYVGADVTVTLADQSRPEIMFFGRLWLTEWCGPEQLAVVSTAGRQSEVRFAPPAFVTPPVESALLGESGGWAHVETPASFHDPAVTSQTERS